MPPPNLKNNLAPSSGSDIGVGPSRPTRFRQLVHIGHLCILGIRRAQLTRMAAALTYRTIFSLIPVLVISLVVLAAFSSKEMVGSAVESLIRYAGLSSIVVSQPPTVDGAAGVEPAQATHLDSWISGLVAGIHKLPFKTIGFVGLLTLIYAAVSMLVEIENSFNDIYRAPTGRSWTRRITQYWTLLTLGAIFLFASFSVTDRVMQWVEALPDSSLIAMIDGSNHAPGEEAPKPGESDLPAEAAKPAVPHVAPTPAIAPPTQSEASQDEATLLRKPRSWLAQTLVTALGFVVSVTISTILFFGVYATVPNTRVHVGPAFVGAAVGATLWEAGKWGFTTYLKFSTGYSQFYGTLALLPLFLLWVYLTWLIVLLGLQIAYSMQTYRTATAQGFTESVFETLGLIARKVSTPSLKLLDPTALVLVMSVVAERFVAGQPSDHEHISRRTGMEDQSVGQMLDRLAAAGLLHRVADADQEGTFALSRPPQAIALADILQIAAPDAQEPKPRPAARILDMLAQARARAIEGKTLADALETPPPVPA